MENAKDATRRQVRGRLATAAVAMAVIVSGCGSDTSPQQRAGTRPKLPAGTGASATSTLERGTAADAAYPLAPYAPVEYKLAIGAKAPVTSAPAYRLVPGEIEERWVSKLARALGLTGDVEAEAGDSLVVRSGSAQLTVSVGAVPSWSYARDPNGSVSSSVAIACPPGLDCPEVPIPPPTPGLPDAADAEKRARDILDEAGIDVSSADVQVDTSSSNVRPVTITPEAGGLPVRGLETSVIFGENARVDYASGFLGELEEVGDYPLVDLETALDRLRSGYGGGFGGPQPLQGAVDTGQETTASPPQPSSSSDGGAGSTGSAGSSGCTPEECNVGSDQPSEVPPSPSDFPDVAVPPDLPAEPPVAVPPPVEIIEITGADVVLQLVHPYCIGDPIYIVPAYAFQPSSAGTVMAVTDGDLVSVATADGPVEPCPGQPGVPLGKPEPDLPVPEPDRIAEPVPPAAEVLRPSDAPTVPE